MEGLSHRLDSKTSINLTREENELEELRQYLARRQQEAYRHQEENKNYWEFVDREKGRRQRGEEWEEIKPFQEYKLRLQREHEGRWSPNTRELYEQDRIHEQLVLQQEERDWEPNPEDPSWDGSQPTQSHLAKREQLQALYDAKEKEEKRRKQRAQELEWERRQKREAERQKTLQVELEREAVKRSQRINIEKERRQIQQIEQQHRQLLKDEKEKREREGQELEITKFRQLKLQAQQRLAEAKKQARLNERQRLQERKETERVAIEERELQSQQHKLSNHISNLSINPNI